jgi:hypothetical protein
MNKRNRWFKRIAVFLLLGALLLAGCRSRARVGALQTESQSVELGDAETVRVEIDFGAGDLQLAGGAQKLLEAGFTYNVARLKPEVDYTEGSLVIRQPEVEGLPVLRDITDFRNEWDLRLINEVPMELIVNMGAGTSHLQLAGLALTGLQVSLGASESTIDLSGDWGRDLAVNIDAGAADLRIRLPKDVGARVEVDAGPTIVEASGLAKDGNVYTNDAYGASEVTLQIDLEAGIGRVNLEVAE